MRTMRAKILLSLSVAMLITVCITVVLFIRLIDDLLVNQAKSKLHEQARKAVHIMSDGGFDRLDNAELNYVIKGMLLSADYFILSTDNRIIDSSVSGMEGKKIESLLLTRQGFFASVHPSDHDLATVHEGVAVLQGKKILFTNEELPGQPFRIFVYSPLSSLRALYVPLMRTTLLSIVASFVVILVIGLMVVSRLVRPLKRLKEAVGNYEPNQPQDSDFPQADKSEIGELIGTFHSMSTRIQQHHHGQIEFLQNVSHELKTPLMSIQGYVYAIQDQVVSQDEGLSIIKVQSQRLIDMVEKLLQLSRLEALDEEWPVSLIDLKSMAEDAIHLLMPVAAERSVSLRVEGEGLHVAVPAEQLFRMMLNLLQNAVRHTSTEVVIHLEAGTTPEVVWVIHVDDDGEGLTEEEAAEVFGRFYTGSNGVTGLGLAICRQIASRLNGELICTRSPLGGARFSYIQCML
ncbi:sensor histidine kinase [Paenibacillus sp. 23TSA30-6]|uniref:sensor histidine kinase n=1 Tax=Paenibacillus sp. 23TSA30-6 TaxID=2546104 RepID=UPI0017879541|nr:HAMP domain-containing sensor histidine kinase [Paenibacillus sp. 23TSA30-6]MBE0337740.1 HAMP domain-containing histidine kinase [Paenibacillus sp. 23TSA30-6]